VVIGQHVILPSGCPETHCLLEAHGFIVHDCEMSEYIKAGGACKCRVIVKSGVQHQAAFLSD